MQSILNAIGLAGSTEAGQEPRSGQKGAGTASDPYDAGNAERISGSATDECLDGVTEGVASLTTEGSSSTKPRASTATTNITNDSFIASDSSSTNGQGTNRISGVPRPESGSIAASTTTTTRSLLDAGTASNSASSSSENPPLESSTAGLPYTTSKSPGSTPQPTCSTDNSSFSDNVQSRAPTSSSGGAIVEPTSGQKPTQKQQGADRPVEEPVGEHADAVANREVRAGESTAEAPPSTGPFSLADKSDKPLGSASHGAKDEKSAGTGERYVKSSGVAADGGDFDAAKPGAGREADRLLEEKGIKHEVNPNGPHSGSHTDDAHGTSKKPSLGEKLKGKLHIGRHHE